MEFVTLEGTVISLVFTNSENGYTVARLDTEDGEVTAAGVMPGVSPGEHLVLTGLWTVHQQYGEQFKAEQVALRPPSGVDEILRYLSSGAIAGIGPARARAIVEKFGGDALWVIEHEPEKLAAVRGITMKTAAAIADGFRRQAGLRRIVDFLGRYGIKPLCAAGVYRDYGDGSIEAVSGDPYMLVSYGAEFSEADQIAFDLGFPSDCAERVMAAVLFELTHNLQNGHTFIPRAKLTAATAQLIGVGYEPIEDALTTLCERGDIVIEPVAGEEGCYLREMYDAECYTASRLLEMAGDKYAPDDLDAIIRNAEAEQGITYADMQIKALKTAAVSGAMALTGGPGTGKTTTLRGIVMLFDALGLKTALCAPTGRAAKRLSETCLHKAATIHRLLGTSPGERGILAFSHNENNPLKVDAVIVDEMSMVDILLMRALMAAMPRGCRFIMVGDADQLPPIGPGAVFSDILRSGGVPSVALREIFRQAEDSGIVRCAHSVLGGVMPDVTQKHTDLFFLKRGGESLAETVAELVGQRLPKNMGLDPSQIQVLSPTRKGESGTARLNERLREAVNPPHGSKREARAGEFLFRAGDKVMQTRNNYDIIWTSSDGAGTGVYNGDIGVITDIDPARETVTVDFEDKLVNYLFDQLGELEPAFAITVHKAQGSEYHAVVLAMTRAAPRLLTRSILYTAMTRARKLLIIVGSTDVMEQMVQNDRRQKRYSGLRARLAMDAHP